MNANTLVSAEMAKKFATEKETPYTRWVREEGLDILSAMYVPDLHTVELKPWPRRGGKGLYLNHDASRTSNDCYVCEIPPGKSLAPQRQLYEEMIYVLDGRGSTAVWNDAGKRIRLQGLPYLAGPKEAKEIVGQWPAYRVSTTQVMTMQHRLYDCYWQMRMPELEIGSDVSVALIAYLVKSAEGGEIAAPGLKR